MRSRSNGCIDDCGGSAHPCGKTQNAMMILTALSPGAARAAKESFDTLKKQWKQFNDQLALVRGQSRSRSSTPDLGAPKTGALLDLRKMS